MKQQTQKSINKKYAYMKLPLFQCDKGWNNLISNLCEELSKIDTKKEIRVQQIKEKFAGLRFYIPNANHEFHKVIAVYELNAEKICEVCGEEGRVKTLKNKFFYKTLCEKHAKKLGYVDVPKKKYN